jgi:hypothetical protein
LKALDVAANFGKPRTGPSPTAEASGLENDDEAHSTPISAHAVRSGLTSDYTGNAVSVTPPIRLFTFHGTVLYVDPASGELRHRTPDGEAINAGLALDGTCGQIICDVAGSAQPIVCAADRCQTTDSSPRGNQTTIFEVIRLDAQTVALKSAGVFLCAEPNGRVTLSRPRCSDWEEFRVDEAAELAGLEAPVAARSGRERVLQVAPFLRAANSPQQRRTQSREFDARIVPFLPEDGTALPQIHCFYEVRSGDARHDGLVAATVSMRTAGHPVRVWSYAPHKLEFLLPHGIEIRAADDVIPRGMFERIVAGSEIRYFSDIFRYAVLYEHGGLWMDTDVMLLRPFPFRGDYFFNLQWRSGNKNHFICGNVMYAKPHSHHLRNLYKASLERFSASGGKAFGEIGPKLLSEYFTSNAGAGLQDWLFSPMLFNSIDWTEIDRFSLPLTELAEYLNDDRVFGIHLWNAQKSAASRPDGASLISLLSDPLVGFPSLTSLADRFSTDKNRITRWAHCYARIYDRLLSGRRLSLRCIMEIGLSNTDQSLPPSVALWQRYFPFCHVIGIDRKDFSGHNNERFSSFACDPSKQNELRAVKAQLEPGSLDVIIDDGSHAAFDQQLTLCELFSLLAKGGWYFIEGLDWQPPDQDAANVTLTKTLLQEIRQHGAAQSIDPLGVSKLSEQFAEILFFDNHFELQRANSLDGLVAIRKRS